MSAPDRRAVNSEYSRYFAMSESAHIAIYNFGFGFCEVHLHDYVVYDGVIFFRNFVFGFGRKFSCNFKVFGKNFYR